jgi:thiamine-monophosphate kinase
MPKPRGSLEEALITRYFRPLAKHPGAFKLTDDAAAFSPPRGSDLVVTTDGVIAGVHFFPEDPPETIGQKALRMNLSDLAAKGAKPIGFLLALALPADIDAAWLTALAAGLEKDVKLYGCALLGGDTDHTPGPISISITAFGAVPRRRMVRRANAKPGERVFVTGTIGDAALGVRLRGDAKLAARWRLTKPMAAYLEDRYLLPQPRNALAKAILHHASAAIDISDGLAGDLGKLCHASGVAADIDAAKVPLSEAARAALAAAPDLMETLLTGGDDYEIALTVAPKKLAAFCRAAESAGVPVTEIAEVRAGKGARFKSGGKALAFTRLAYSHF